MKFIKFYSFIAILAVSIAACKKDPQPQQAATLNVINASVNTGTVAVNYFGAPVLFATYNAIVNYSSNQVYTIAAGNTIVSIVPLADTLHPIYTKNISTANGDIYSLFLTGQSGAVDSLLIKDNIPYRTDSTVGIRFINLSPNSPPVSINVLGQPNGSEYPNLAYKAITDFKTYPVLSITSVYKFQIKNASTGVVLGTFNFGTSGSSAVPRFFNCTLVLKGLVGGSGGAALGVFRVNNY